MTTILTKRSNTASSVPGAGALTNSTGGAELAVNTADKRLFVKDSGGTVVEVGTNPSVLNLPNGTANGVLYLNGSKVATSGSALVFDGTNLTATRELKAASSGIAVSSFVDGLSVGGYDSIGFLASPGNALAIGGYRTSQWSAVEFYASGSLQATLTSTGLGIGTASPGAKLDVNGSGRFRGFDSGYYNENVIAIGNASYDPKIGMSSNGGYRWNMRIADVGASGAGNFVIRYEEGSLDALVMTRTGNLGLGVTPSAWISGALSLDVRSTSSFADVGGSTTIANNSYRNSGGGWVYKTTNYASKLETDTGQFRWFTAPSGTAGNAISWTQAMTLDASGNLGIGTASPAQKLDVNGVARVSTEIRVKNTVGNVSYLTFEENATSTSYTFISGDARTSGYMGFWTNNTERMRLDSSGNVGIGVTPSAWNSGWKAMQVGSLSSLSDSGAVTYVGNNFYQNASSNNIYLTSSHASLYGQTAGQHIWYTAPSGTAGNAITFTQAMTLDASGNLGVGITSPAARLHVRQDSSSTTVMAGIYVNNFSFNSNTQGGIGFFAADNYNAKIYTLRSGTSAGNLVFATNDGGGVAESNVIERARITSSGNFCIGSSEPGNAGSLNLSVGNPGVTSGGLQLWSTTTGTHYIQFGDSASGGAPYSGAIGYNHTDNALLLWTNQSEKARITNGGDFLVGQTTNALADTGHILDNDGLAYHITSGNTCLTVNRKTNDGTLVDFLQDGTSEGSISVSGNTVSYNAFAGSHWSQLQDGSKPDILRGTVMESINELCVWPDENNERLPKSKISDTAGSKKVYGVFMAWDNDWTGTNDMYVTAVGAFICRVNGSVTVEEGDLLESNGDGTARVQADDIIRSSTIGKVTSTVKTHQYDDGSYCVPTVLYCG